MNKHIKISFKPEEIGLTLRENYSVDERYYKNVDRRQHGEYLERKWKAVMSALEKEEKKLLEENITRAGRAIEFISGPGLILEYQRLEDRRSGLRLLNVKKEDTYEDETYYRAVLFVPKGKEEIFERKIRDYINPEKDTTKGDPRNFKLFNNIETMNVTDLTSYWTSKQDELSEEEAWYELWFHEEDNALDILQQLDNYVANYSNDPLYFPETMIVLAKATKEQLTNIQKAIPFLSEIRKPSIVQSDFFELHPYEREEYVQDLIKRTQVSSSNIMINILDEGMNIQNSLLKPFIPEEHIHTLSDDNGSDVHLGGHGTLMAGVALFNDLATQLDSTKEVHLEHTISSMKIIPDENNTDPLLYGKVTMDGVENIDLFYPEYTKIHTMAVSTEDFSYLSGAPTSWSASLDKLTFGVNDGYKRLFLIAAGNIRDLKGLANYPDNNLVSTIEDPAQSWNALTVGAYTELINASENNFEVIANFGGLSPFSKTSYLFDKGSWPIKPEIVFEGGNAVKVGNDGFTDENLSLISTSSFIHKDTMTTFTATSAASAKASWFAAKLYTKYPEFWPETIRGLIVHSADWTEEMKSTLMEDSPIREEKYAKLLRTCGYGVPNLAKAIDTVNSNVTLLIEDELQPYYKSGSDIKTNIFHLHRLPWPVDFLQSLGEEQVRMRVTLSYFIEPSPGSIGWDRPNSYISVPLRFDLNGNLNKDSFIDNISRVNWSENIGYKEKTDNSVSWTLGKQLRDKGSIHSDIWEGSAIELALNEFIAVYPITGWWRNRKHLNRYNEKIRYSLIVSLEAKNTEIDLLTAIETEIKTRITIS